jgi:hypothetical protein
VTSTDFEKHVNDVVSAVESDDSIVVTCTRVRDALRKIVPSETKLEVYEHDGVFSVSADIGAVRHRVVFPLG